jgi:hypothetical protein
MTVQKSKNGGTSSDSGNWKSAKLTAEDKLAIYEALNSLHANIDALDYDSIKELVSPDVILEFPEIDWKTKGIDDWIKAMKQRMEEFPPFQNL